MRPTGFLIGLALTLAPVLASAQTTETGATMTDSGSSLSAQLELLATDAPALGHLGLTGTAQAVWNAEVERYAERSRELRTRCHDDIRKSNRDTIVTRSAQCLRGDVLLELTHRQKQKDMIEAIRSVSEHARDEATDAIDAWIDAANAVVDGVDAKVFRTTEALLSAKRNLHRTYRSPLLLSLTRLRAARARAAVAATAAAGSAYGATLEDQTPFLTEFVPCLEQADALLAQATESSEPGTALRSGSTLLRTCLSLFPEATEEE